jgi:hypothetical protein
VGTPEEQSHPKRTKERRSDNNQVWFCMANSSLVDDDHAAALMLENTLFWLANKHVLDWLTLLLWLNLVGRLLRCHMESTMNVQCVCCPLSSTGLDFLCHCHQMDLTAQFAMIAADVLFRGKGVTLLDSHRWILAGRRHKEHHWMGLLGNGA